MAAYFISQATGHQARSTIAHLLEAGAKVHALVRNFDKAKTHPVLQRPGVTLFEGESVDTEAVTKAVQGCAGVFLNTFPIPGLDTKQAKTIIEESKKAGIKTIVATTTFGVGNKELWDDEVTKKVGLHGYFQSKYEIETMVRNAGFDAWTILRPAFISFDYMLPGAYGNFPKLAEKAELDHFYDPDSRMGQTDIEDIGKFAAAALQDPSKFRGHAIDLVRDNLTIEEVRQILVRVTGRKVTAKRYSPEEFNPAIFGQAFHFWANVKDISPVMESAKAAETKFGMPFTSLEDALTRDKERVLECIPVVD
ncbi:NmrA-like family protein [Xylariaceae sp. FL0255]|nr:NmrA-like family protein [Xylariaceae sp. FL0255]